MMKVCTFMFMVSLHFSVPALPLMKLPLKHSKTLSNQREPGSHRGSSKNFLYENGVGGPECVQVVRLFL